MARPATTAHFAGPGPACFTLNIFSEVYVKSVCFYRATHMHSADYAVARCPSVRLSVRPSHAGILSKRLYTVRHNYRTPQL